MKIKTIIVDDNREILTSLENNLKLIPYIQLDYATLDSEDFLETVLERRPDLVIMDIDMPRLNGIELGHILREKIPYIEIVYVTSHIEYIKDAFTVYASDFLEKPYDLERLRQTLDRIAKKLNITEKVIELKSQKKLLHLHGSELVCIEAFKRKSIVYTDNNQYEVDHAFNDLLDIIALDYVFKSSRSFAINLLKVAAVEPFSRTSLEVSFKQSDFTAMLSKNSYDEFREQFKKYNK